LQVYRCISTGRVQGVWYRKSVFEAAARAGFRGYVRNLPDGSVETVVAVEDPRALEALKEILYKGSMLSRVESVRCEPIVTDERFTQFEVRA
jgi:acylphosphatase